LVLRALLDRLGLRSQREGLPVIVRMSGVEKRRSDGSLPVAGKGGAFATPPQSGLT
jgi:hypothetical protein